MAPSGKKLEPKNISVVTQVTEGKLYLRQSIASAELEDGRRVEVDLNVDGALLISVHAPKKKGWKTYVLAPSALVDAVLIAEDGERDHG